MKCQILFSGENKKRIIKNLSSAFTWNGFGSTCYFASVAYLI